MSQDTSWWTVVEELEAECKKGHTCLNCRAVQVIHAQIKRAQDAEAALEDLGKQRCEDCNAWEEAESFRCLGEDGPEVCADCYEACLEEHSNEESGL